MLRLDESGDILTFSSTHQGIAGLLQLRTKLTLVNVLINLRTMSML